MVSLGLYPDISVESSIDFDQLCNLCIERAFNLVLHTCLTRRLVVLALNMVSKNILAELATTLPSLSGCYIDRTLFESSYLCNRCAHHLTTCARLHCFDFRLAPDLAGSMCWRVPCRIDRVRLRRVAGDAPATYHEWSNCKGFRAAAGMVSGLSSTAIMNSMLHLQIQCLCHWWCGAAYCTVLNHLLKYSSLCESW